jgi:two-component system, cell cycle sensor histidine kinase and response regulator CckA
MEELFRRSLLALPEPILVVEGEQRIVLMNPAFAALLDLSGPTTPPLKDVWPDVCVSTCTSSGEITSRLRTQRGELLRVKLGITVLTDGFCLVRVLAVAHSDEDASAYHSQRLETLGMLAGGFAHDFNNLLTGILGHITYLRTILPGTGSHIESLQAIQDGAKRASFMTREMLTFARQEEDQESDVCDVRDIVLRTCTLLRGAVSPLYTLRYKVPEEPLYIQAIPSRISQVIANLIINARDAVKSGGIIEVGLELVEDKRSLERYFGPEAVEKNRYLRLFVVDDGHGISQGVQAKIFDPFFSTKKGKGTGLGLTTVASIVRGSGGSIEVFSREDVGTSISIYFPSTELNENLPSSSVDDHTISLSSQAGVWRILVVDDEYLVRNVLSVSLKHLGYEVETASSGREALELFTKRNAEFDVVILDMVMPQMSGEEVFERLKELNSKIRVIMVSGMCSQESVNRIMRQGGRFIRKPFTIHDLADVVQAVLAESTLNIS